MKTKTYKWARRWKRAVANGQHVLAEYCEFNVFSNACYGH